jgi:hypothetical protein
VVLVEVHLVVDNQFQEVQVLDILDQHNKVFLVDQMQQTLGVVQVEVALVPLETLLEIGQEAHLHLHMVVLVEMDIQLI